MAFIFLREGRVGEEFVDGGGKGMRVGIVRDGEGGETGEDGVGGGKDGGEGGHVFHYVFGCW